MTKDLIGTIGGIVALVIFTKVTKAIVGNTAKAITQKRMAPSRKKRGVTLGQVVALPAVAIASVLFGSRKRRGKTILDNDPRWEEPGSRWRDPSDRYNF